MLHLSQETKYPYSATGPHTLQLITFKISSTSYSNRTIQSYCEQIVISTYLTTTMQSGVYIDYILYCNSSISSTGVCISFGEISTHSFGGEVHNSRQVIFMVFIWFICLILESIVFIILIK